MSDELPSSPESKAPQRIFTLVTLERRSGTIFPLRNGLKLIGSMVLNGSKARHEMELSEEDYLKHAKDIAQLCRVPGCAVYVAEIREEAEKPASPPNAGNDTEVMMHIGINPAGGVIIGTKPVTAADHIPLSKMPFFALKSIAKREGVDISELKTNAERAAAINEARKHPVTT